MFTSRGLQNFVGESEQQLLQETPCADTICTLRKTVGEICPWTTKKKTRNVKCSGDQVKGSSTTNVIVLGEEVKDFVTAVLRP